MKRMRPHVRTTLTVSLCMMLALTGRSRAQTDTLGSLVDVGTFTINVPDLDDWKVRIDKEKGVVELSQTKQELLSLFTSGAGGSTIIVVFKTRPEGDVPGLWMMTEQEMANDYRTRETMVLFQQRQMHIVSVDTDAVSMEGRKYYRLLYTARFGKGMSESILYLYFPPEFPKTKEFFGFLISESYVANSMFASKDLEQINPLLRSLQTVGSASTLPGVGGDLLRAAASGDSTKVKHLVEGGASVNDLPANGRGPLALAALHGHESIVRYLTDRGAVLNPERVPEVYTPLASALLARNVRIAEYLLDKGARATAQPDEQMPPLSRAITMHLDTGLVAILLDRGANPNLCRKWTPLMYAANEGLAAVTVLLIDHGARLDMPGEDGQTPLMVALRSGHPEVAGILLARGPNPNAASSDGTSPLMCAAIGNDTTSMARLLELGARVNASNQSGGSALSLAAAQGHLECVRFLLSRGAAVDPADTYGVTPFCYALVNGHVECARVLLDHGADINARSHMGRTPLMWVAQRGDSVAVRFLIDRGATLDLEDDDGDTALDLADDGDFDAIVAMLKEAASAGVR